MDTRGDGDRREKEINGGMDFVRKRIGWIGSTSNVLCTECAPCITQGRMKTLERFVGGTVAAIAFSPAFNDSLAVGMDLEINIEGT